MSDTKRKSDSWHSHDPRVAGGGRVAPVAMEELEPRLLLSADPLGAVFSLGAPHGSALIHGDYFDAHAGAEDRAAAEQELRHELLLVDTSTPDYQQLIDAFTADAAGRNFEVHLIESSQAGLAQVSNILAGYTGLDAVHVISHGSESMLQIGTEQLNLDSLAENAEQIAAWGQALDAQGDLLLYGCDLAASADGRALVGQLAALTGADVAASDDLTGHAQLGGDWDLEYRSGTVEAGLAADVAARAAWQGTLDIATYQEGVNGYTGTQDTALHEATPTTLRGGDTIITIDLDSPGVTQGLLRFDNLFGSGPGQIPYGSTITSVTITLEATDGTATAVDLHRMLSAWDENATWDSMAGGIQLDDLEAASTADATVPLPLVLGPKDMTGANLVDTVQAWADGATNQGWVLVANGTDGWDFASSEAALSSLRPSISITYTEPTPSLWISTLGNANIPGGHGITSWTDGEMIRLGEPNIALEPGTTDGTFSSVFNVDDFAQDGNGKLNGMYYVNAGVTVGSVNAITLQAGDLLFAVDANETFSGIAVTNKDVMLFRPDVQGDYSSGTFTLLLENPTGSELQSLSLVERGTTVGDVTLAPGEFLFSDEGTNTDVMRWETIDVGSGTTSGTTSTLLRGSDINITKPIIGIQLVQRDVTLGSTTLYAGQLLLSIDTNDTVGDNLISVKHFDIFALDVTATGIGTSAATASLIFEGLDVGLASGGEEISGIALRDPGGREISGQVLEDVDGDALLGDAVATAGVDILIYLDDGDGVIDAGDTYIARTSTGMDGSFSVTWLNDATYWVVVDSTTIAPTDGFNATFGQGDVWAEQTYGSAGAVSFDGSFSYLGAAGSFYGGMQLEVSDDASALTSAEHVTRVAVAGGDVAGVDSAFSFSVITRTGDGDDDLLTNRSVQGSLRQFIDNANAIVGLQTGRFQLSTADSGYNVSGNGEYYTQVAAGGFAYIIDPIILDATTQAGYAGTPLIELDGTLAAGSTAGLVLRTDNSTIRGFIVHGFPDEGLEIDGSTGFGDNNTMQGNWVGVDSSGVAKGNADNGILITAGAFGNQIGGTGPNDGNVVVASGAAGILIRQAGTDNNIVEGNYVGVGPDGVTPMGNLLHGIWISDTASNNMIGGTAPNAGNLIAHNTGAGVLVDLIAGSGNSILGNSIHSNSALGIDLSGDGLTINDAGDVDTGPNDLQNTPVLTVAATDETGNIRIEGTLNSNASETFRIEFFANSTGDVSASGEGEIYLGFVDVTTDGSGNATFSANLSVTVAPGTIISATATSSTGSTSEFAANLVAISALPRLDLDSDDSSGAFGADFLAAFVEDGGPVAISDADATLIDLDSSTLSQLTVTITNLLNGTAELLSADTTGTSIFASYDSATGVLTLSGVDTLANYEQVLRTITYDNSDDNPDTTARVIEFVASDGTHLSNVGQTTLSVAAVNDAPVLTPSAPNLTTISEDNLASAGDLVSVILGASVSDGDAGAVEGIAITALSSGNGVWEYSIDGGTTWLAVGAVSDANALLLRDSDLIRFVPDGQNADAASFDFRAWDQSSGTEGTKVDVSTNGGATAFSSAVDTASITVTAVNDAPVLTPAAPTLTTITEDDVSNGGNLVSTILGASVNDVDSGALEGIAITALSSGNGVWEYSIDGGTTWLAVGAVSDANALLLRDTDLIRFVPDGLNADAASFDFRAWDQTSGSEGTKVDVSTNGGITAFSAATDTASITVTDVNDAPVLTPAAPTLTSITEDDTSNAGHLISTILGASVSDVDSGALEGIAITALSSGNGVWEYSIDGGTTWLAVGVVSDANALLLRDSDLIRFVPDGQNADAASFDFRAWDQTSGSEGTKVDVSTNGGATAFSSAVDTASITVTAVNDAPVLTPAAPTLTTITEDDVSNGGNLVSTILGASVNDVDSGALEGIAITALSSGNGVWEYSIDGGTTWLAVGAVSDANALLLRDSDLIRFVPDGQNADAASFDFRAWDQTSGSEGTKVDVSTNGGATAFSSAVDTASITVTAVNDAPVLTPAAPTLTTITEDDVSNGGNLVSTILGASVNDVDSGALEGIAITALSSGNGVWEYSIDGGTTWLAVGAVSDANALLLRDTDLIRFVPDGLNADAASFDFRAWDQTSGSEGTKVDVSTNGGITAFSAATDTASITVTDVNDAPVLTPAAPTLTTITEDDTSNAGHLVSTILGASVSDVDSGALEGIAITALSSGNGVWEYSIDGGTTWLAVGAVSDANALLLRDSDLIRFVPDGQNADAASFDFRAWDQSSGTEGTKVDVSTNGGITAFSSATDTASITVTDVNDAPVLTPAAPTLTTITEDDISNSGNLVSTILGATVSDVDSGALEGIAITALSSGNGVWEYSIDGGTTWLAVGAVSDANALLLRDTDLIRFVPDGLNADAASFDFRAWDQTSGSEGTKVDVSTNGGITAFSAATDTASITVTDVNDAPVLTPAAPTLTTITEDDTSNAGHLVSTILGASVSDVDSGALEGIAITALSSGNGVWEYSIDGGTTWLAVGAVSDANALLLRDSDLIRFVPDGQNADAASFDFRAWDQSSGTEGTKVDVSTNGGITAFSSATDTASITVTDVNDAPVLTPAAPTLTTITEDNISNSGNLVSTILGATVSDVDSGALEGIAITALSSGNGVWEYSIDGGTTWLAVGVVSDANALLLRDSDLIRFVPDGQNADAASFDFRAWDQSSGTEGTKVDVSTNGGATAFSSAVDTASITVTAVNDAPVLTPAAPTLTTISEDDVSNGGNLVSTILGASVNDVDSGALEGIAITALSSGNGVWEYSIDGGTTWLAVGAVSDANALLLRDTDLIRFVPDSLNADAASFDFRAWDQTSGSEGTKVDVSTNGGITAFSAATDTASITVTDVNDAPVLTPAAPTLTTITEDDTSNAGHLVSTILGASVSDVDSGALEGIAITALSSGNGVWEYSIDGGTTWLAVGAVSDANALLLRDSDLIRFVPDGQNADAASFDFRAWDQSSGTEGTKVDVSTNGGITAFSSATDTASITVTDVNDAPVLTPAAPTLTTITEDDISNSGNLVSTILGATVSDVDSGALEGIAITALSSGNGVWEYSIDGGTTWLAVGAVSDANALLLRDTDLIRFVPDGLNADAASFDFRAWDQTSGSEGTKVDVSTNGGITAFSAATDTASITVTDVNDAPVLTPAAPTLTTITEDDTSNAGHLISTILGASVSDVDSGALEGIAITALSSGNGVWEYSIDGGTTWLAVGAVSDANALLLRDSDLIRFVPDGQNADAASFDFRAWDQSSGTEGTKVDVSTNGGITAFSSATDTASITVTDVNDAPVLTPAAPTLTTITEDDISNSGNLVSTILGATVSDVDSGALEGIAITALSSGNGVWEYSIDGGTTWLAVGAVSDANALLLRDSDLIRFVPDGLNADAASFDFRAWDQTSGSEGTKVDVSTNGGITAFSSATDTASITVTSVNDNPQVNDQSFLITENSADGTIVGSVLATDPDTADTLSFAITGGTGVTAFTIDAATGEIRVADSTQLDLETTPGFTLTVEVTDAGGLKDTALITITLTAENEAPAVADQTFSIDENMGNGSPVGIVVATDPDAADTLSYSITGGSGAGVFVIDSLTGEISVADTNGMDFEANPTLILNIEVRDAGGLTDTAVITITINDINEAPTTGDVSAGMNEDHSHVFTLADFDFQDVDGDSLNHIVISELPGAGILTLNGAAVSAGQVVTAGDLSAGLLRYTPGADGNGSPYAAFRYFVSDGSLTSLTDAEMRLDVLPVNDAPVAGDDNLSIVENTTLNVSIADLLSNDFDVDADALTFTFQGATHGTLVDIGNGTLEYRPDEDFTGEDSFVYRIDDGAGGSTTAVVTIQVTPRFNVAPSGTDDFVATESGQSIGIDVGRLLGNDADADGDALQIVRYSQPTNGSLVADNEGGLLYVPGPGFSGIDRFTYTIADEKGAEDTVTVTIQVRAATGSDLPAAPPGSAEAPSDTADVADDSGDDAEPQAAAAEDGSAGQATGFVQTVVTQILGTVLDVVIPPAEAAEPIVVFQHRYHIGTGPDGVLDGPAALLADRVSGLLNTDPALRVAQMLQSELFQDGLGDFIERMTRDHDAEAFQEKLVVGSAKGGAALVMSGLLGWIARGSALFATLVSSLPIWMRFDPLPVLTAAKRRRDEERDPGELSSIIEERSSSRATEEKET